MQSGVDRPPDHISMHSATLGANVIEKGLELLSVTLPPSGWVQPQQETPPVHE